MRDAVRAAQCRRDVSERHFDRATRTALAVSGALFSLLGCVIALGGYLSSEGSPFHVLAGSGLIISGALISRRHWTGALTYMLVFAGTVTWSLRNIAFGSSLGQRLIGPALLLIMIAAVMPQLCRWRPRQTVAVFTLLICLTVGLGVSSLPDGPLANQTAAVTQFLDAETKGLFQ